MGLIWKILREVVSWCDCCCWCVSSSCAPFPVYFIISWQRGIHMYVLSALIQHVNRRDDAVNKQDSHCSWLLIWNAWIMDRIWMCCQILLYLSVCVNSSMHKGDEASCDGAFDIYFVLDRWVSTDCFLSACMCLTEGIKEPTGQIRILISYLSPQCSLQSSPCMAVFSFACASAASLQVCFNVSCSDHQYWKKFTFTASRAPHSVLCCC